ncbi:MAG: hypothetical protein PHC75_05125 [Burkholderiales bacterium]|nr:hypothetical protein [Burkholderiales bacterium]
MMNKTQINFIQRAFTPKHTITINEHGYIINADEHMNTLLSLQSNQSNCLFEKDFYELLSNDVRNNTLFINTFKMSINYEEPMIIAINSDITVASRLAIPCIYLFLVIVQSTLDGYKTMNFYNLIEVAKETQSLFNAAIFSPTLQISKNIKKCLKKKSLYFATEALKPTASILNNNDICSSSSYNFVDIIKNFHATERQQNDKLYKHKLFKLNGYLDNNKNQYQLNFSQETINKIIDLPVIAFNSLQENIAINV